MGTRDFDAIFRGEEKAKILEKIPQDYISAFTQAVTTILSGTQDEIGKRLKELTHWQVITNDPDINDALIQFNGDLGNILIQKATEGGIYDLVAHNIMLYNVLMQEGLALIIIDLIRKGDFGNMFMEGQSVTAEVRVDREKRKKAFHPKKYGGLQQNIVRESLQHRQQEQKNQDVVKQRKKTEKLREKAYETLVQEGIIEVHTKIKRFQEKGVPTIEEYIFDKIAHLSIIENHVASGKILEFDLHHQGKRYRIKRHIGYHDWSSAFHEVFAFMIKSYKEIGREFTPEEIYQLRKLNMQNLY